MAKNPGSVLIKVIIFKNVNLDIDYFLFQEFF